LLLLPLIFERWGAMKSVADVWARIRQRSVQPSDRSAS